MAEPPCYDKINKLDCEQRSATCHSTCPRWAEYEKERDAEYRERSYISGCATAGKIRTIRKSMLNVHSRKRNSLYKERWE